MESVGFPFIRSLTLMTSHARTYCFVFREYHSRIGSYIVFLQNTNQEIASNKTQTI